MPSKSIAAQSHTRNFGHLQFISTIPKHSPDAFKRNSVQTLGTPQRDPEKSAATLSQRRGTVGEFRPGVLIDDDDDDDDYDDPMAALGHLDFMFDDDQPRVRVETDAGGQEVAASEGNEQSCSGDDFDVRVSKSRESAGESARKMKPAQTENATDEVKKEKSDGGDNRQLMGEMVKGDRKKVWRTNSKKKAKDLVHDIRHDGNDVAEEKDRGKEQTKQRHKKKKRDVRYHAS